MLVNSVGDLLISKYYLNEDAASRRLATYQESFKDYIETNHISIRNVKAITKWIKHEKNVYLIIYKKNEIFYESGYGDEKDSLGKSEGNSSSDIIGSDTDPDTYCNESTSDIKFGNGIYTVSISEFTEVKLYDTVRYLSWGVFFLVLSLFIIIYNHRIITRILQLSKEVSSIEKGNLGQEIYHKGNDELSLLALNADNMRNSIVAKLQSEKEAWEANSELITSMSHDIRTPLTSIIGYLEILDAKNYHSEEQLEKYIKSCKEKSIQLKELSDKLFQYFLVFGKENINMQLENFNVNILFQQLLCEHVFDLKNLGFNVITEFVEQDCILTADIQYLKRLFNNLFSNVAKYANPNDPVTVIGKIKGNNLIISISNYIRNDSVLVESTNIGLKTCQKIVEQMNGTFETWKDQSHFEVRIIFSIELTREE